MQGKYWGLTAPAVLLYTGKFCRVGIYLDYTKGQVAFFNAENISHFFTFNTSFKEKIFPFCTRDKNTSLVVQ